MQHRLSLLAIQLTVFLCLTGCKTVAPTTKTTSQAPAPGDITVSFSETVRQQPVTGRVVLLLSSQKTDDARQIDWFNFPAAYALLVTNLAPGEKLTFKRSKFLGPDALAFPLPLGHLTDGIYYAQAVIDVDDFGGSFNSAPGNL